MTLQEGREGDIPKRAHRGDFETTNGRSFSALRRAAAPGLNTSETRPRASALCPGCMGSMPDHLFSFSQVVGSDCSAYLLLSRRCGHHFAEKDQKVNKEGWKKTSSTGLGVPSWLV